MKQSVVSTLFIGVFDLLIKFNFPLKTWKKDIKETITIDIKIRRLKSMKRTLEGCRFFLIIFGLTEPI